MMWEAQNFSKSLASDLMISFRTHFTTWDEIDKDSWFLIEPHEGHPEPFDTLDAVHTVYYGDKGAK